MKKYTELSKEELLSEKAILDKEYAQAQSKGLSLDMSRGKPSPHQLDLEMDFASCMDGVTDYKAENGFDCRNYGLLTGIPECRKLFADMMGVKSENVFVFGNSSLNIMYDSVLRSMMFGVLGSTPWCKLDKVKWICPAPGYDRHFAITEQMGIEMITVPMTPTGPDMDIVEELVKSDSSIKGMWIVPKYSNPTGYTCSDDTVKRLAKMETAAEDFRIYWDNAYAVHDLYADKSDELLEILSECEKAGNPNRVYEFCSTSKVTFPGAGVAAFISSVENLTSIQKYMTIQTIGHDKTNQLRHVRFLKDNDGIRKQMMRHADDMRPKFEMVDKMLTEGLEGLGIGTWTRPNGGYFISFDAMEGCAKAIVAKCKEAGVTLTGAGATFPYKKDPKDSNIRIAPSYPSTDELKAAAQLFVLCTKLVSIEKLLEA